MSDKKIMLSVWVGDGDWTEREAAHVFTLLDQVAKKKPQMLREFASAEIKRRCDALWVLLDDIDTLDDAAKSDDAMFRRIAMQMVEKRHTIADGADVSSETSMWKETLG